MGGARGGSGAGRRRRRSRSWAAAVRGGNYPWLLLCMLRAGGWRGWAPPRHCVECWRSALSCRSAGAGAGGRPAIYFFFFSFSCSLVSMSSARGKWKRPNGRLLRPAVNHDGCLGGGADDARSGGVGADCSVVPPANADASAMCTVIGRDDGHPPRRFHPVMDKHERAARVARRVENSHGQDGERCRTGAADIGRDGRVVCAGHAGPAAEAERQPCRPRPSGVRA